LVKFPLWEVALEPAFLVMRLEVGLVFDLGVFFGEALPQPMILFFFFSYASFSQVYVTFF